MQRWSVTWDFMYSLDVVVLVLRRAGQSEIEVAVQRQAK